MAIGSDWLPTFGRPIIGFDFDQTISVNGVTIMAKFIEIFDRLENEQGYLPVIISGRNFDRPLNVTFPYVIDISKNPEKEKFYQSFNPIKFKLWVLNHYMRYGDLLFYVENDPDTYDTLKEAGFPVISLFGLSDAEWEHRLQFWIKYYVDRKAKVIK